MNIFSRKHDPIPTAIIFGLIAALIWGMWPVASAFGIKRSLSAFDITALRVSVGGLILLPLFWKKNLGFFGRGKLSWKGALLIVTGAGLPYILTGTGGLEFAPAGHFGVITPSTQLVVSSLGSWFLLKEKPSIVCIIAIAIIILGVFLTGWEGLQGREANTWIGDLLFVSAGILWATFILSARYYAIDTFHAAALISVWSMVFFLPIYLIFFESGIPHAQLTEIIFQGIFQGFLTAVVALIFFTRALATLGVGRTAVFPTLVPGATIFFSIPILNEYPTPLELIGVIVVSIGMMLALGLLDKLFQR